MDTDRNLLFGVISMQAGLIDASQFVEACSRWACHKETSLADLLVDGGLISDIHKVHIEYLLERRLEKHDGDLQASLTSVPESIRRSLTSIGDADIRRSVHGELDEQSVSETQVFDVVTAWESGSEGRYEMNQFHASGGMGRVWYAWDKSLGRTVALKELRSELAGNDTSRVRFQLRAGTALWQNDGIAAV